MKKKEIRHEIKMVYRKLWDLLSLFEETEGFNEISEGGQRLDAWHYLGEKLYEIRASVYTLFLGEQKIKKNLIQIIDETEYFVSRYEIPGVVDRWLELNPKLKYFDPVFDIMETEAYKDISTGTSNIKCRFYPDEKLIAERKAYFQEIERNNSEKNLKVSEDKIYQDELLRTLSIMFEKTFKEYL